MGPDLRAFERWLRANHYAEQSIVHSLQDAATMAERLASDGVLRKDLRYAAHRLAAYAEEKHDAAAAEVATRALARLDALRRPHVRGGRQKRERVEKRIDDALWTKLVLAVRAREGLAYRVLDVMAETGLRVNDVLQVHPVDVRRALDEDTTIPVVQKGGEQIALLNDIGRAAWERLVAETRALGCKSSTTLAQLVSPRSEHAVGGPNGPYQKVRRTLRALCRELGVSERVWTHRFRHTFATRLANATGNVRLVAGALNHSGLGTVGTYVGSVPPAQIAAAVKEISVK